MRDFIRAGVVAAGVALLAVAAVTYPCPAAAQQAVGAPRNAVSIAVGEGRLFRLDRDAANVLIADSTVADVQIASARLVYVYGRKVGQTTLTAVGSNDSVAGALQIRVVRSAEGAQAATAARGAAVELGFAGNRLVVRGPVRDVGEAMEVEATAQAYSPNRMPPLDRTRLAGTQQITLRVRIAEVQRNDLNRLGVNLAVLAQPGTYTVGLLTNAFASGALGGGATGTAITGAAGLFGGESSFAGSFGVRTRSVNADALINALTREGVITLLAEPNLTALSGETASFLAGGEIPIPVPQGLGTVGIMYKQFGVNLSFTPTLLPGNRIAMRVRPEVSDVTGSYNIQNGVTAPIFTTRRTETSVEMASGQTVAISGLFQRRMEDAIDRVPGLSEVPVLGALFRSQRFLRGDTELMVLVTPFLSAPIGQADTIPLPTDPQGSRPRVLPTSRLRAGFVVD